MLCCGGQFIFKVSYCCWLVVGSGFWIRSSPFEFGLGRDGLGVVHVLPHLTSKRLHSDPKPTFLDQLRSRIGAHRSNSTPGRFLDRPQSLNNAQTTFLAMEISVANKAECPCLRKALSHYAETSIFFAIQTHVPIKWPIPLYELFLSKVTFFTTTNGKIIKWITDLKDLK